MGPWYHRVELPDGTVTPGDRDQSLVYALYEPYLPESLEGCTVLDLGANACALSIEFARRGARVTAIEHSRHYSTQAAFVLEATGCRDRVELLLGNVFAIGALEQQFDIVCYVGLAYHVRHPQLLLDLISHRCRGTLLASSQTIAGDGLTMTNRAMAHPPPGRTPSERPVGSLVGWEPTERLFVEMIASAGFQNPRVVSTSPHAGEAPGRLCGNRTYCVAGAADRPPRVALLNEQPLQHFSTS